MSSFRRRRIRWYNRAYDETDGKRFACFRKRRRMRSPARSSGNWRTIAGGSRPLRSMQSKSTSSWRTCLKRIGVARRSRLIRTDCDFQVPPELPSRFRSAPSTNSTPDTQSLCAVCDRSQLFGAGIQAIGNPASVMVRTDHRQLPCRRCRQLDRVTWFFVGTHAEYDKLLSRYR